MRIERVEASKHKRGRVLVFLEDGACLKITEQELLDFGLRSGDELDEETLKRLKEQMELCAKAAGGTGRLVGEYPAWQYDPDSELRRIMVDTYKDLYGREPVVSVIHAGLECGLFLGKRSDLDCVSCGPNVTDVHSVNEQLEIASTQRTWEYLKAVLENCK